MNVIIDFRLKVKYHLPISHLPPGVVSFCFDDHVHNNHLVCSDCHTQSRLTLLLRIHHVQKKYTNFNHNCKVSDVESDLSYRFNESCCCYDLN